MLDSIISTLLRLYERFGSRFLQALALIPLSLLIAGLLFGSAGLLYTLLALATLAAGFTLFDSLGRQVERVRQQSRDPLGYIARQGHENATQLGVKMVNAHKAALSRRRTSSVAMIALGIAVLAATYALYSYRTQLAWGSGREVAAVNNTNMAVNYNSPKPTPKPKKQTEAQQTVTTYDPPPRPQYEPVYRSDPTPAPTPRPTPVPTPVPTPTPIPQLTGAQCHELFLRKRDTNPDTYIPPECSRAYSAFLSEQRQRANDAERARQREEYARRQAWEEKQRRKREEDRIREERINGAIRTGQRIADTFRRRN